MKFCSKLSIQQGYKLQKMNLQRNQHDGQIQIQQEYVTSINELIAEPETQSHTEYFLSSLYQLSEYLFQKKINQQENSQVQVSFDEYVKSVSEELTVYDNILKKNKESKIKNNIEGLKQESALVQCYQRVPYLYFQNNFILNFGQLSRNCQEVKEKQEQLNEQLDLVQINLFTQIHHKFHDYFKVVANFDYLSQSIATNMKKIKESRCRIKAVKKQFIDKSKPLRYQITHRQNLQKTLRLLKIVKSLKKLPAIITEILESSLPYECLSLLKQTKESLAKTEGLIALNKTTQMIKDSQILVQRGLNKRYTDQLYLYIEQIQNINLGESWEKINAHNCMDSSTLNNSYIGNSGILDESILQMQPTCSKHKRKQGKQYEISMIILQSYRYIEFQVDPTKIKICNSLRVFSKKFEKELAGWLNKIFQQKAESILESQTQKLPNDQDQELTLNQEIVERVTVTFYVKHLYIFNEVLKDTVDRYLGYLHTLILQYQEFEKKDEEKFINFIKQELSILPSIFKIIREKIKFLMTLKNISNIGLPEFLQWIGVLEYWQKYIDTLIQDHPFVNYEGPLAGLQKSIEENLRNVVSIMSIKTTISDLSLSFITSFHTNVLSAELHPALEDESWQSVEIPSQFITVLNSITKGGDPNLSQNISITILNDSSDMRSLNRSLNKSLNKSIGQQYSQKPISKYRLLKNNIFVDGNRYKVSVSFLLLCEFIQEYCKMAKSLNSQKYIFERLLDMVDSYNSRTKQLILEAKARQFQKMKSKNISAKHLCLLHNCLSLLAKLLGDLNLKESQQVKAITLQNIELHKSKLIEKLSTLLKGKIESMVNSYLSSKQSKIINTNLSLLNVLVQMMEIVDEYLEFEHRKDVFRQSIDIFMSKYFKHLILKGSQLKGENKILLEKMKFLRQYFPEELQVMEKQIQQL